ncbi:beta-lactamase-like protein [Suillus subalutaceus]|uniref:beta-lactamase-like protein n=1 Tax=Suillus subalutaceus TaxID=48586 RepID=UPI001B8658AE|nr:beta-lactamase-like protein [Suillus subalutaceus]KAG1836632.1 beta-lactamase-like protein [Suillus subalutaceus]
MASTGLMLPPPSVDQPFMHVSALEGGNIRILCDLVVDGNSQGESISCPSLAFSLQHSKTKSWAVFDLGIRRDLEGYTPLSQERIKAMKFDPVVNQTVAESLVKGGVYPHQIETVIISHLHWDHIGDHEPFTRATFVVGEGCRELLTSGYPIDPNSLFSSTALPHERTKFLPLSDFSVPIGPFPLALDFFGDGSMYVIDAPGHIGGHINILARTSSDGAWILLGGDSAHDYRLITGEKEVAHSIDSSGRVWCMHGDKDKAVENIARIRSLLGIPRVQVLIAHDSKWYEENKGSAAFLPGTIPPLAA